MNRISVPDFSAKSIYFFRNLHPSRLEPASSPLNLHRCVHSRPKQLRLTGQSACLLRLLYECMGLSASCIEDRPNRSQRKIDASSDVQDLIGEMHCGLVGCR
jgi:hypothetical protein